MFQVFNLILVSMYTKLSEIDQNFIISSWRLRQTRYYLNVLTGFKTFGKTNVIMLISIHLNHQMIMCGWKMNFCCHIFTLYKIFSRFCSNIGIRCSRERNFWLCWWWIVILIDDHEGVEGAPVPHQHHQHYCLFSHTPNTWTRLSITRWASQEQR